jgi:tRNA-intron endonuclease, archaea type
MTAENRMRGELIENRIIVWNIEDSRKLFSHGYYGKPIGIPKPKPEEINVPLILDLIEGLYLLENKKIIIYKLNQRITVGEMTDVCKKEYHDFDKKYIVYKNFRGNGYIINPGIKFGCDFAVYEKGPGIDHAPYLIQVYSRNDTITSTEVVLAGRLATTVRKQFILAIPKGKDKVDFLALDWWKA